MCLGSTLKFRHTPKDLVHGTVHYIKCCCSCCHRSPVAVSGSTVEILFVVAGSCYCLRMEEGCKWAVWRGSCSGTVFAGSWESSSVGRSTWRRQKSVVRVGELDLCSKAEVRKLKRNKLLQPWVILARCRGMVAKGPKTELELKPA